MAELRLGERGVEFTDAAVGDGFAVSVHTGRDNKLMHFYMQVGTDGLLRPAHLDPQGKLRPLDRDAVTA